MHGASPRGSVCVHDSANFNGRTVLHQDVDSECVTMPFAALAAVNTTDEPVALYATMDCTRSSFSEPPENFHS